MSLDSLLMCGPAFTRNVCDMPFLRALRPKFMLESVFSPMNPICKPLQLWTSLSSHPPPSFFSWFGWLLSSTRRHPPCQVPVSNGCRCPGPSRNRPWFHLCVADLRSSIAHPKNDRVGHSRHLGYRRYQYLVALLTSHRATSDPHSVISGLAMCLRVAFSLPPTVERVAPCCSARVSVSFGLSTDDLPRSLSNLMTSCPRGEKTEVAAVSVLAIYSNSARVERSRYQATLLGSDSISDRLPRQSKLLARPPSFSFS